MAPRFTAGDSVQTSFGKGTVREVRNNGRLLVDVHGRALLLREADVSAVAAQKSPRSTVRPKADTTTAGVRSVRRQPDRQHAAREIDLHGLTVEEALARVEEALNDALLADQGELRLIHGRSGGRIRSALHQRLREIAAVKAFAVDPRNEGVTVVRL